MQTKGSFSFVLYHTPCRIDVLEGSREINEALGRAKAAAHAADGLLNRFDGSSELSRLNDRAGRGQGFFASDELFSFLLALRRFWVCSGGAFDPTVGALMRLWDFTAAAPKPPSDREIARALERTGFRWVELEREGGAVRFLRPGLVLDAGGAGKGYAADRVADALRASGVTAACVNFGGNLSLLGRPAEEGELRPWRVGLQDPCSPRGGIAGILTLAGDTGVSTSGGYDRFFVHGGRVFHHILDPRTGYPAESDLLSATVLCPSAFTADLLSTTAIVMGKQAFIDFHARFPDPFDYVLIDRQENILCSNPNLFEEGAR